jgi:hypothetical protein
MSTQEIYFRTLIVLIGVAIIAGAFILEAAIVVQVMEALGGAIVILITFMKRFSPWH